MHSIFVICPVPTINVIFRDQFACKESVYCPFKITITKNLALLLNSNQEFTRNLNRVNCRYPDLQLFQQELLTPAYNPG